MKVFAVLVIAFAAANAGLIASAPLTIPATTLLRAPSHDSAVIQSDRLGGNFAYSVNEAHAYAAVSPVVQRIATPVAVSYAAPSIIAQHAPVLASPVGLRTLNTLPLGLNTLPLGLNTLPLVL